jgi:hypothetical protein
LSSEERAQADTCGGGEAKTCGDEVPLIKPFFQEEPGKKHIEDDACTDKKRKYASWHHIYTYIPKKSDKEQNDSKCYILNCVCLIIS